MSRISLYLLILALAACGNDTADAPSGDATSAPASAPAAAAADPVDYAAAVASTTRLAGDYARDADRKPDKVLEFFGVDRGMTVLDMFSGGGYYTEILSHVVGEDGRVVAHTNEAYLNFVRDEFGARHAEGRLPNVDILMAENNELDLAAGEYDVILLVLSYHDLYYADPDNGWPAFDIPTLLAEFHEGLADDGFIAIIDHAAAPGTASESGGTVHRIDPDVVIADMETAGFICESESNLLANAADDYSVNVFDPAVRGKTDRFLMKFVKADQQTP